ncbi:NUDIX hydrolase [Alsobacter sp. SYSU M60028]|uniref:NUDIX hydrolase n=1 Tax=Alsobacter ponti TaxID=2962936 RepID=A0ABT1L6P2_9HYPH|nr:NUDIX hydrolase [Alsobacter ponti]MCP8937079.1 NUDIX hydrolase [Alsobacter ponti]
MKAHRDHGFEADAPPRVQYAALPYRYDRGELFVLLVTSRDTGRWIIPKGWPVHGKKPHKSAAREALEEAGVVGVVAKKPVGVFEYWKRLSDSFALCAVRVFPLYVERQRAEWREQGQRQLLWTRPSEAAELVDEPGLSAIILAFEERMRERMARLAS